MIFTDPVRQLPKDLSVTELREYDAYAFQHDGVLCRPHAHNRALSLFSISLYSVGQTREREYRKVSARSSGQMDDR